LFIQDPDLRDSIRSDISAANRALHDGLWKAATILAGAAAEALLLWAITEKKTPTEIEATRAVVISRASQDPNDWVLDGCIKVARALALIEDETEKQADLAWGFRNFIHPGRSARQGNGCDRGTALSALAAVELIVRDLSRSEGDQDALQRNSEIRTWPGR
jgi:ATP-dependent protease HslVU (ClpYQ) peptidase subunit